MPIVNAIRTILAQVLVLVFAVALPLSALVAYNLYQEFVASRKAAAAIALGVAEMTAAESSRVLRDAQDLLLGLARRPSIQALDPRQCDPLFSGFLDLHPRFVLAFTVNLSGMPVCAAEPAVKRRADPEARRYDLQELRRTGKFSIGKPILGPLTGRWVVPLYQPLHDAAGSLNGAVAVSIDLVNFHPLAAGVTLAPETSIHIINGDGLVVASLKNPEMEVGRQTRDASIANTVLVRKRGEARAVGSDGIERIYGFVPVPGTDWHAYAGVLVSVAFAEANRRLLVTVVVGIVAVLLAVALAVINTRKIVLPIRAMADTAHEIVAGHAETRFRVHGASEIAEVATQFNRALDALARGKRLLRLLSHRLFEAKETERRELARELHDRLGQNVTTLNLNLNMLREDLPAELEPKVKGRLDDCESLLYGTGKLVRDLMGELRPPGLDELGLLAALHEHARRVAARSGLAVTVHGTEVQPRLAQLTEITLFRIAQEALINVLAHARATEIAVTVDSDPDRVVLTVADNGCGFDAAAAPPSGHLGIFGMRERADAIGGRLRVESVPGAGTRVIAEAPRVIPADRANHAHLDEFV